MFKKLIAKGNLYRSDFHRALITDTTPGDVPIIFSNDGFYKNLKVLSASNQHLREFVELMLQPTRTYTLPYRYNILQTGIKTRRLSLVHPSGQVAVSEFYRDFGDLICYYCRKSASSIRAPKKIGSTFFVRGPSARAIGSRVRR